MAAGPSWGQAASGRAFEPGVTRVSQVSGRWRAAAIPRRCFLRSGAGSVSFATPALLPKACCEARGIASVPDVFVERMNEFQAAGTQEAQREVLGTGVAQSGWGKAQGRRSHAGGGAVRGGRAFVIRRRAGGGGA